MNKTVECYKNYQFFFQYRYTEKQKKIDESQQFSSLDFRMPWDKLELNIRTDHTNSIIRPQAFSVYQKVWWSNRYDQPFELYFSKNCNDIYKNKLKINYKQHFSFNFQRFFTYNKVKLKLLLLIKNDKIPDQLIFFFFHLKLFFWSLNSFLWKTFN